ncbi:MAG: pseudouridine synthase [Treponema sp.]|nr:pseudouridine synthase [Treponema sp.]
MNLNFSEPVDHILVRAGLCSDRSFKTFIRTHKVEICRGCNSNSSEPISDRNELIDLNEDSLFVDGNLLKLPDHLYVILNKPVDVVCSRVSDSHKTVYDFLPDAIKNHPLYEHLHVAGRLDSDSRGLVLLTSNGKFSASLSRPESHVEKIYEVQLRDSVPPEMQAVYKRKFEEGFEIPPEKKGEAFVSKPAKIFFEDSKIIVKISEGKFHQVRRMFSALGNQVMDLKRVSIGNIVMSDDLIEGKILQLSRKDFG